MLRKILAALLLTAPLCGALAEDKNVEIRNAWVRATVPGQDVAGAYMEITSAKNAKLKKVESPVARTAEIHSMRMEKDVMRMQAVESLSLPAKETVKLAPGGYHLMLMGLTQQLKPGESVPIRLTVSDAQGKAAVIAIDAPVKEGVNH